MSALVEIIQMPDAAELSRMGKNIEEGLSGFEAHQVKLKELVKEYEGLKIGSLEDEETIKKVNNGRKILRSERGLIEKMGKYLRNPLTQLSKHILERERKAL